MPGFVRCRKLLTLERIDKNIGTAILRVFIRAGIIPRTDLALGVGSKSRCIDFARQIADHVIRTLLRQPKIEIIRPGSRRTSNNLNFMWLRRPVLFNRWRRQGVDFIGYRIQLSGHLRREVSPAMSKWSGEAVQPEHLESIWFGGIARVKFRAISLHE